MMVDTNSDSVLRRQRMLVFKRNRLSFTGCRLDIRRLSGRGKTTTFCEFRVYTVAVMEKSCDVCGERRIVLLVRCFGVSRCQRFESIDCQ
jgi:hypothetical protein